MQSSAEEVAQYFQEVISSEEAQWFIEEYTDKSLDELLESLAHPLIQSALQTTWAYESDTNIWVDRDTLKAVQETASHTLVGLQQSIINHLAHNIPDPRLEALSQEEMQRLKSDADSLNFLLHNLIRHE